MSDARHGIVVDRRQTGGGYVVQDEEDGRFYTFDYLQIVTEGFRTIRVGERVRFHTALERPGGAEFVIRLDQPDPAEYYG